MQINPKWLIIGGILILLLVAFGRNPVSEAHKRLELSKKGKDPLIEAIQEHNAKNSTGTMSSLREGSISPPPVPTYSGNSNIPSYMMRSPQEFTQPGYPANPYQAPNTQQPAAPNADSYYPPAPHSGPVAPPQNPFSPQSYDMHKFLSNGKPILSAGSNIFTRDPSGKIIPMPDGVYSMYNGEMQLIIQGGHHMVISN